MPANNETIKAARVFNVLNHTMFPLEYNRAPSRCYTEQKKATSIDLLDSIVDMYNKTCRN